MEPEVLTYVVYDIEDDRIRARIANTCKDYGLRRVQYSAFSGPLNANKRGELFLRLRGELGDEAGKILLLPICEKDVRASKEVVNLPSEEQGHGVVSGA